MPERDAATGYAQAMFSVAEAEGALETVEDELFRFARSLEQHTDLRDALTDPALPVERKKAVLRDLLGERASGHTVSIVSFLVEQGQARHLSRIIDRLAEIAAERRRRAVAEVRTAVPLDAKQRDRLTSALASATGKEIELKAFVDPSVVGGVFARVGDVVIDGTVRRRLELARQAMRTPG